MDKKELDNLRAVLNSDDLDYVKQGVLLWETLITDDFDDFMKDFIGITDQKNKELYKKKKTPF